MIRPGGLIAASALAGTLLARDSPEAGSSVSVVITVVGQKSGLAPVNGQGGLQLWLLIDDGSRTTLGSQLAGLKAFVLAQPATTQVGIGYMRNGAVQAVPPLTSGHQLSGQYLLTFLAKPQSKPAFQTVKIGTELPHVTLVGPSKVYVPARQ